MPWIICCCSAGLIDWAAATWSWVGPRGPSGAAAAAAVIGGSRPARLILCSAAAFSM
jgi:hypothetical protein